MRMDINTDKVRLDDICLADFIDIACGAFVAPDIATFAIEHGCSSLTVFIDVVPKGTFVGLAAVFVEFLFPLRHTIADDLGRQRVAKMDRDALLSFVEKELRSVQFGIERRAAKKANDVRQNGDVDVRAGFSREIAWVMSHYKMSIDTRIVSASVYANLVRRASEEVKAMAKKA